MVLSTPWDRNSAGPAKDTVTYPGTVPTAKSRAKATTTSARARAHTNGARATTTGTRAGGNANSPVKGYQKGDGKSGGKGRTAVEIISHEIAPKVQEKEASGHWKPGRLGRAASGDYERRHPSTQVHSDCREN